MSNLQNNNPMFFLHNPAESKSDFVSLYFEEDSWGKFFELVNEYESLQIQKLNADAFSLTIGKHEFKVSRDFKRWMITMSNISTLVPGAAELLAKIADLLFHDRKNRLMLQSSNLAFEEVMWQACFTEQVPLKPVDSEQHKRFQMLAEKNSLQNKISFGFERGTSQVVNPNNDLPSPRNK